MATSLNSGIRSATGARLHCVSVVAWPVSVVARPVSPVGLLFAAFLLIAFLRIATAAGDEGDLPRRVVESDAWTFESVRLRDGTVYTGLIGSRSDDELEFVEIHRPEGAPMFAVVRPIPVDSIEQIQRLPPAEHEQLADRFHRFRNRTRIEAGEMRLVELTRVDDSPTATWQYNGPWFRLLSTADEEMTRRCVVRIEQIFRAYRLLLAPTRQPDRPITIRLFGELGQYRGHLQRMNLKLDTAAFFSTAHNEIVASSQLNSYARRLRQIDEQLEELRRELTKLDADFNSRIARLREQLQQIGYSAAEIEQEVLLRRAGWRREFDAKQKEIERTALYNDRLFADVTDGMFRRLAHEAFHAYVANYIVPRDGGDLPRWLNEGLAQVFEGAQLDADVLRVDAPARDKLLALQHNLRGPHPLKIEEVVSADEILFLIAHGHQESQELYVYSWGLAYHLLFHAELLHGDALARFAANPRNFGPRARFVALINQPLDQFEAQWREAILAMRVPPR